MTVARGIGSILLSALGIIVFLSAVVLGFKILGSNAPINPIISDTIDLRNAEDPVRKAQLITELDDLVQQAENEDVSEQWSRMTSCLATSCPDEAYFDMILVTVAVYENKIPQSALLINLIATNKYWGDPEQVIEFSKAMSTADEQVNELDSRNAAKIWSEIVACNAVCPERNDLFFDLINVIVRH